MAGVAGMAEVAGSAPGPRSASGLARSRSAARSAPVHTPRILTTPTGMATLRPIRITRRRRLTITRRRRTTGPVTTVVTDREPAGGSANPMGGESTAHRPYLAKAVDVLIRTLGLRPCPHLGSDLAMPAASALRVVPTPSGLSTPAYMHRSGSARWNDNHTQYKARAAVAADMFREGE